MLASRPDIGSPRLNAMQQYEIHHDPVARRFTTVVEGIEAEVNYHYDGDILVIHHTGVPRPNGGRGLA